MRDDFRAQELQSMYHAGAVGALNALAEECTRITFILVKTICKKKVLRFSRDRMEEIAHDAAALIIARYLKSPEYTVRKFYAALWDAAQEIMFDGHRRRQKSFEENQSSLPQDMSGQISYIKNDGSKQANSFLESDIIDIKIRRKKYTLLEQLNPDAYDPRIFLDELVADHPRGKRIVIDLARAKSYKMAIRRIESYVRREWIYAHAEKIYTVFKTLHWKENTRGRLLGAISGSILESFLYNQQSKSEQSNK